MASEDPERIDIQASGEVWLPITEADAQRMHRLASRMSVIMQRLGCPQVVVTLKPDDRVEVTYCETPVL